MKQVILAVLLVLGAAAVFSGCERNDYQHPLHRK
jgi:predicted small secreted protein